MATNENLIDVPGRLHSIAMEGHVSGANEIYDDSLQKDQQTLNSELNAAVSTLLDRVQILENKVAHYHPEGVSITVSPQRVTLGEQVTIDIDVVTTSDASMVEVYRVDHNTHKLVGRSSVVGSSWSFTDVDTPQDTESLVYRVEATIGSDLKTAEARVTVEEVAETDYYVGWATGDAASFNGFNALTAEQLENLAIGYSKRTQPSITKTVAVPEAVGSRQIFFLMWKEGSAPVSGSVTSGGILENLSAADFLDTDVFRATHDNETIDGNVFHVAGMRGAFDAGDVFVVNF